ncbi:response regulator transcription factor [Brevibacterium sp. BRM-1]|uniref:response regulator n=1 Tax=Brevibacterium sp. BRM-1 TaxID=2999062 RepID=UPI0022827A4D|nr:response regulator transcription factor [Brevibacterium sp. BRM-1]WAL39335.1 response regulator transcription factor [Brevibacterium sp. BRM-1]
MIRVLLADDEPLVRAGLHLILESAPDLAVVAECRDGREALERAYALRPDVVLMDVRMPVLDGIEATRRLLARSLAPPGVLVLTAFDADEFVVDALAAGAAGFLLKTTEPRELLAAVRTVAGGTSAIDPGALRRLADAQRRTAAPRPGASVLDALSEREREVARLIADGQTNAQIAAALHLALPTVKTHVARILHKTGADNRVRLAIEVLRAQS